MEAELDLSVLGAITDAVESGAGLHEVVRAAARALDASLVLTDRGGGTVAVAVQSPADEAAVKADGDGVEAYELRVADEPVGTLRMRSRSVTPGPALVRLVTTLIASEVERVRAPERASQAAASAFVQRLFDRDQTGTAIQSGAEQVGVSLEQGATVLVVRAHSLAPAGDGWRTRALEVAERGARAVVPGALAARAELTATSGAEVVLVLPGDDESAARRAGESVLRELQAGLPGHGFAVGRSRVALDAGDLHRGASEALLAANVAESDPERPLLAFDETGAYRLLLPAMSEDPAELQRFYAETVEPLAAYDEQYETELVVTLETFLDADGNVAGTAARLFTHRHTIRYRLERVRELSGLDVGSTDGREKLSLGLKAMRVLGIATRGGPAREAGAEGGRVPRR
jgi:PucR family transcriptional regulator, purine catabolism regulatory protein